MRHITLIVTALALVIAAPAIAGKGGNPGGGNGNGGGGGGNITTPSGACSASGGVVTGTGLPADQVLNFMVTDSTGTWGWVLGYSDTGTWPVAVPSPNGATTYEFASRTWGPDGSKYSVFATCSA